MICVQIVGIGKFKTQMVIKLSPMIKIYNEKAEPILKFKNLYEKAKKNNQKNIEAGCLTTICTNLRPHARFVNIKYINNSDFIFFTNYKSPKADDISFNNNIALTFFWNKIETQIRIEGIISKINPNDSDEHWNQRSVFKNALAVASNQSKITKSFDAFKIKYNT